ncbi:MAG TPA: hypothetical protein VN604_07755, partial [Nitrospirota bacterium]|nr:hypothetical protein [Nitrospirota bacterium]
MRLIPGSGNRILLQYFYTGNYPGLPLSTGAEKRAVTVMATPLQPKQRVRSESAAGTGIDDVKG